MQPDLDSRIDRYMNRELHPAAARALAHEALEDSDLFDELAAVALARAAVESPAGTDRGLAQSALDDEDLFETLIARGAVESSLEDPEFRAKVATPHKRGHWVFAVAGVAAAAAALVVFYVSRPFAKPVPAARPQQARTLPSKPAVAPAILLTSDLEPPRSQDAPVFRGTGALSRAPKSDGIIVSVEDGVATVNLGSLDGLAKGTELSVIHGGKAGRIVVTTIFRDRARGKIVAGDAIQSNDPVRVPTSTHLAAVQQQVNALASSGDLKAARDVAQKALAEGTTGETRLLLERLAALDYQAGAPDIARERYEVAVNNFDEPPAATSSEQATTLASYGTLCLLAGDAQRADNLLRKALLKATDPTLRSRIVNNLAASGQRNTPASQHP